MTAEPQGTLLLSPHPDDIVFSLGGSVALKRFPSPLTLLTIFGRSRFTEATGPNGDLEQVSRIRQAEDEQYAARHQLQYLWLGYGDALQRLGWRNLFLRRGAPPPSFDTGEILERAQAVRAALIVAPLGLGRHVDHLIVSQLASAIAGDGAVAYYEDLPYAVRSSRRAIRARAAQIAVELEPLTIAIGVAGLRDKLEDCGVYASQFAPWIRRALEKSAREGTERLWANSAARSLLALPSDVR